MAIAEGIAALNTQKRLRQLDPQLNVGTAVDIHVQREGIGFALALNPTDKPSNVGVGSDGPSGFAIKHCVAPPLQAEHFLH